MTTIQKGVPIPGENRSRRMDYPFEEMKIGDSFLKPLAHDMRVRSAITYQHKTRKGKRFTAKRTPQGIRVWRVK